ncbi:MAG: carbohydrate-binding protein [Cyanobacteria bacterium J06623_7]
MNEALFLIDSVGGLTFSSTFTAGTFQLTNNSDTQDIVSISLDLRDAIFPDLVFDPNGEAGDSTARGFQFDSQNNADNTIAITDFPFANAAVPFSSPHDGGFDVLTINFDSFEPGQTLRFSTDVDPTSIQGSDDPGPNDSGSISGLELTGARISVRFADDTELTGQVYRTPNSDSGSEVTLTPTTTAAPEISAIGLDASATVGDANQTIRVTGTAGSEVSLLVLEGAFYTEADGGFDPDPFEANTAIAVNELNVTIGADGFVDVPVSLTRTDAADGGLNYIVAKYQAGNSLVSDRLVIEYEPGATNPGTPDPGDSNPNIPAGTIRIEAEDYKAGTNGTEFFDFDEANLGGAFRPNEPVDIEATSDVGGGFNVGFIQDGEFLTYDVEVAQAGTYNIVLRVATPSADTQTAEVTLNGQTYTATFEFTGSFQEYTDVLVANVNLPAGTQELRLDARSNDFNLNYIDFVAAEPGADTAAPTAVLNTTSLTKQADGVAPATFTITYSDNVGVNVNTIDGNDLTVTAPDGTEMAATLVSVDTPGNGTPRTAAYAIAPPGGTWDVAEAGDYTVALNAGQVNDINANSAAADVLGSFTLFVAGDDGGETPANPNPNPNPPNNSAPAPEGTIRIQAEDYLAGTNGTEFFDFDPENLSGAYRPNEPVDIETTGDTGGGFNVSFIRDGEFLTYDVEIAEAGTYDVVLRVATPSTDTQSAEVAIGGETYTATFDFTGGFQEYTDVLVTNVNLTAGTQQIRFDARSSEFNFNYIDLVATEPGEVDAVAPTAVLNTTALTKQASGVAPANFTITYSDDVAINGNTIDGEDLTVTAPDGTELSATLVEVDNPGNGTPRTATYAIAAPGGTWDSAEAGEYTVTLKAGQVRDTGNNAAAAGVLGSFNLFVAGDDGGENPNPNPSPNPNPGVPAGTIRIEAEEYKAGTNGTDFFDFNEENLGGAFRPNEPVDIEATGDVGGGFNVAFIQDGEFLTYDVNVAQAGSYDIILRVATPSADTQSAEVTINGETYTASFEFTGGFQEYTDVLVTNVDLAAGAQELRIDARSSEFNLNYIDLVGAEPIVDEIAPTAVLNTTNLTKQVDGVAPANFTVTYSDNNAIAANTIDTQDLVVTAPDGTEMMAELVSIDTTGNDSPITATYAIAVPGGTWDGADAGDYTISIQADEVSDPNGNSVLAGDLGTISLFVAGAEPPEPPQPVGDTIRIEAENYRQGIHGVDYLDTSRYNFGGAHRDDHVDLEATSDAGGGFNVSWIEAGEFLTYDIDVPQGGIYDVVLRVASTAENQSLDIVVGGETTTAEFGNTGGSQSYEDVVVSGVNLAAGNQALRLNMNSNSFDLNYFELVPRTIIEVDTAAPRATLDTTVLTQPADSEAAASFTITYSDNVAIDAATIDANDLTVTAPDGTELGVTLVSIDVAGDGSPRTATYAIAAPGGTWDIADVGEYTVTTNQGEIADTSENLLAAATLGAITINVPDTTTVIEPIRIEAEDYKAGTNGTEFFDFNEENLGGAFRPNEPVDIEATGDVGGGFNVGFIQDGEFLTYDVEVAQAGTYNVILRVATPSADTQTAEITLDDQTYTATFESTGGFQEYTDVLVTNVNLAAGTQELRFDARSSDFNLNYIELVATEPGAVDATAPTAVLNTAALTKQVDGVAPANFTITYSDDVGINANTIDAEDLTVTAPNGTEMVATLVSIDTPGNGTPRTATYAIAAPGGSWDSTEAGDYTVSLNAAQVNDTSGNAAAAGVLGSFSLFVAGDGGSNPPNPNGTIRIEAEDYKAGTNGTEFFDFDEANLGGQFRPDEPVDIETTGDVGGGFNVAFIQDGEFLTYDVDIAEAGTYNVVMRVATPSADTQTAEITLNGETYTSAFSFTGGFQEYTDVLVTNVNLAAGAQELRFDAKSSEFNLNYIELVPAEPGAADIIAPTTVLDTAALTKQPNGLAPANFTLTFSDNVGINVNTIDNSDLTVTAPDGTEIAAALVSVDTNTNGTPRSATYSINAPGGAWDVTDAGSYTVSLNAGEVSDTSGNSAAAGVVGNFNLNVAAPANDNAIRINAGATEDTVGVNNQLWLADANFTGGQASTVDRPIVNTEDDFIYQSQRAGDNFSYSIPVEDGNYQVNLYLAELDFDDSGAREFDVSLEGELALNNYDIFRNTRNAFLDGDNTAKIVQLDDLSIIRDGALNLDFASEINNATVGGIEILPIEGARVLIEESGSETQVTEGGNNDTYQVVLNTEPTADVTINLQPDSNTTLSSNSLVFTSENWSDPQTVTVTAVDDNISEGQHLSTIAHSISTSDSNYAGLTVPSVIANIIDNDSTETNFTRKDVASPSLATTAAWGPDGRLYVGSVTGNITAYTFDDNYGIVSEQSIGTIAGLDNHNITGIAFNPFENDGDGLQIYVSHNEFRANNEGESFDVNTEFSPYTGQVSTLSGANFGTLTPVVQNIGVSNHDHGVNGLIFDENGDLLITVGSATNAGIADQRIGGLPESPFTVAILKAEITKPNFNGNIQYELPADYEVPDSFTGNFNPADSQGFGGVVDVVDGVDVSIYASGLRNPYDLVYATNGNIYATENGANSNFGDVSTSATTQEPFVDNPRDELNLIEEGNYYGQPNRNRGRQDDRQNRFFGPNEPSGDGHTAPLTQFDSSTNGLAEYRSTTFGGQLRGNLLAQNLGPGDDAIAYSVELSGNGEQVLSNSELETSGGSGIPVGQGVDILTGFSGSILSVDFFGSQLRVATPVDDDITTATAYEIDEWRAPASGGGSFTIGGTNFSNLNDTSVTIGNETAEIIRVSDKRIFGTLPAFNAAEYANEGLLDITVTSGGETSIITDAFQPLFV